MAMLRCSLRGLRKYHLGKLPEELQTADKKFNIDTVLHPSLLNRAAADLLATLRRARRAAIFGSAESIRDDSAVETVLEQFYETYGEDKSSSLPVYRRDYSVAMEGERALTEPLLLRLGRFGTHVART
jgi:hypothetical protein